uniref:Predicted protein n=1 Tax=Hordeum vulgare subsp. vulgare TaxID=112509 RepID=F2DVH6_HORVV|nr:predicted protein [Hordeum vulgare subsp. vulgare]
MSIVKSILAKNPKMKLLMLGDIDQTIFTWRGADLIALDNFISEYDEKNDYEKVTLKKTHRLGSAVLEVSQKLIRSRDGYLQFRNKYY